jgi:hypothetical protein
LVTNEDSSLMTSQNVNEKNRVVEPGISFSYLQCVAPLPVSGTFVSAARSLFIREA